MNKKILIIILSFFLLTGCSTGSPSSDSFSASLKKASTTPYGKYPEKITYTLAQMTGDNNSNMPKGDTYENNAYTRYLLKKLNVQNKDVLRAPDELYFNKINNIILSKDLPDIMIVEKYEDLKYLHDHDMIADLSEAYKNCASRRVKDMYNSYGSSILENVSFNNKIYAMPETNIDDGPNLFWVREDWLKACHLNTPHTLKDVENIVRTFQKKKMGKTKTTGIMVDTNLTAATGFSSEYLLNLYFAYYNTYPKQWIKKDGKLLYGSIDSNVTKALSHLRSLYDQGILDRNLLLRKGADIAQEIIEENCGAFFGPWWVPNNPLIEALKKKAFIVSTIIMILMIILASAFTKIIPKLSGNNEKDKILIVDNDNIFENQLNTMNKLGLNDEFIIAKEKTSLADVKTKIKNKDIKKGIIISKTEGSIKIEYVVENTSLMMNSPVDIQKALKEIYSQNQLKKLKIILNIDKMRELELIDKINKMPNTDYINIWLQRLTIKLDRNRVYNTHLCQKIYNNSTELFDTTWISSRKIKVDEKLIIDEEEIEKLPEIISIEETSIFNYH